MVYRPALQGRLVRVVAQGVAPSEHAGFNCTYDRSACDHAEPGTTWVALPASDGFDPTRAQFEALPRAGLPGLLRDIFLAHPEGWEGENRLWDDAAALWLLQPGRFRSQGGHQEPTLSPEELRALWLASVWP